jgi:hypothetical protein
MEVAENKKNNDNFLDTMLETLGNSYYMLNSM